MSRIDQLIDELAPSGVEYLPFSQVGTFSRGGGPQKKDFQDSGVGCIHYGQIYTFYGTAATTANEFVSPEVASKSRMANPGDVVIAVTGENDDDLARGVAWLGEDPVAVSNHTLIFTSSLDPRFVSYFLRTSMFDRQKRKHIMGTKVRSIAAGAFDKILIPVPPLEVQCEIVRILDIFSALEAELETELEARTQQYEYYQRQLLDFTDDEAEWMTLGDIGRVAMCKRIFKHETAPSGDVPFFKIGTFGREPDAFINENKYEEYKELYLFPKRGDILISASGTIGRTVVYDGEPAYFQDSNIVWLDHDESIVLNRYLRHWYQVIGWSTDGGTIRRLYNKNILRARIAVPPLEEQQYIADILDKFDALVNDPSIGLPAEITARRQQYEYYRDKLLTFQELEGSA